MTAFSSNFASQPTGPVLDEGGLLRLVALAGPVDGRELMRRLISDLRGVVLGMSDALVARDRVAMRQHSHVLLGIAGTIGAQHLHELAQLINRCVRDDACTSAGPHVSEALLWLDGLIGRLRAMAAELGMGL